ncbi:D-tyrosyl-tRNA(Tyr) deacylase [Candidatus Peregrinibacteria bacterium CG11_big_fil_rev_8_21_14_0_20_46_8]|nr:MAG: D-tyrosyl-tRNA(Tyr) deacylase [Candidatus Peregrinibacteria bacterium CG11_big_fil_rev_8_21_14_0_20_46_8]
MRALLQRVSQAKVSREGRTCGEISQGHLILLGITHTDTEKEIDYVVEKILNLRVFEDDAGKMNKSLLDIGGALLVVSQFTLYADVKKGRRPSFITAADPAHAESLYNKFVQKCREAGVHTETGEFGAHMLVELVNDGPVTIMIDTEELSRQKS